ncbi:MAG TPA: hypothetical protein ENF87_02050 [Thermoproteales archaeon]|nr:hypothetical protein [Thermoproteales archaeon]
MSLQLYARKLSESISQKVTAPRNILEDAISKGITYAAKNYGYIPSKISILAGFEDFDKKALPSCLFCGKKSEKVETYVPKPGTILHHLLGNTLLLYFLCPHHKKVEEKEVEKEILEILGEINHIEYY